MTSPIRQQQGLLSRSLVALLALAVLGASATAITYLITNRNTPMAALPQPLEAAESAAPIFATVEPFTVTLAGQGYERLLHVGMTLKLADERSLGRINAYMPVVRSRILLLLSEQNPDTVQSIEGKRELVTAVRNAVNAPFDGNQPQQVMDVLFTAFVVQ